MRIPYRWIREFVDLEITAEAAADRLINAGVEVAGVTALAPDARGVVIGQVEGIERELGQSHGHRLVLCRVSTGRERFSVVCGAPNVAVGVKAAFAPPGAVLPGGHAVGVATIRGTASQGMLCSERELGVGEEHEAGLLLLDVAAPVGGDLLDHLGLDDRVLEIEITPNRPDCLSVVGVARELAALTGARFSYPEITLKETGRPAASMVRVQVADPDLCPRYTMRVIDGVRVGPSPARLAARLRAVGLRPISNVVDVTNYVMWELGQPLHAFDFRTVTDATVVVRRAKPGERLTTLDGQDRPLAPDMLLIADPQRGIGLAGVMGGENTEVSAATTRVLLESAYFHPASIRRTSRALNLPSDAAYRFERGADIEGLLDASARAAQLIAATAGALVAPGVVDVYPHPRPRPRVRLRMARVQRLIGAAPPLEEARRILDGLGLTTTDKDGDVEVEVPGFRRDITMEDDLVEEVVRVWGYERIPSTLPGGAISLTRVPPALRQAQAARRALVGAGLVEAITYVFSDPARALPLRSAGDSPPLELMNPLSQDASLLRQHPLEGLLGVVATNVRRQQPDVRVFEVGRTYTRAEGGTEEPRWVGVALTGARRDTSWHGGHEPVDVYDAKGLAEHVLRVFGVEGVPGAGRLGGFEPDVHGALVAGATIVAEFGEIAQGVRERFGIDAAVYGAVISLDALARLTAPVVRYQPLPRFPSVQRDMAFVIDDPALAAAEVERAITEEAGPLLRAVGVFDVFRFPDGRRSVAWRLTFQAADRTLTDDEVNTIHARVAARVGLQFHITLRGGGS
ncbi:MAG: phenylalanine--tRNA ligase subunit beta [Candidatus Rokuibacteriota bacterium]